MSLAEKFQITVPPKSDPESNPQWVWPFLGSKERVTRDIGERHENNDSACCEKTLSPKYNQLPPGMEIGNQLAYSQDHFGLSLAGVTDVSADTNRKAMGEGFTRKEMKATDDQYGGKHIDLFYGEAKDEHGNVGFVERNNYLDRM